jgi:peptidoglycan hydrolase-like protein with peptidoglycan-binding domain
MRRWLLVGGGLTVAAAAAATVGVAVHARNGEANTPAATTPASNANVATVTRRDLARTEELDGVVGYGTESALPLPLEGTLTALPAPGTVIDEGSVVAEIDGQPVIALIGAKPMWRDLGSGVDDGADVLAIEQALERLGFTAAHEVTVDGDWTDATTEAVEDFQEAYGQDDDGQITRGEIVFITSPQRVASVGGVAGQQSTEAAIQVTSPAPSVSVDVELADATLLAEGDEVTIELPDESTTTGTVASIGAAETDEQGDTTLPVEISSAEAIELPPGTPVDILVSIVTAEQVLAVPVEAVLAVVEGGFAVEVRNGTTTELVGVELGVFADGYVEISGDVAEGAEVVIP